jgi:hypothetical protein
MWNRIVKHVRVRLKYVPSTLRNPIPTLRTMNGSDLKRPMNECVGMSEV